MLERNCLVQQTGQVTARQCIRVQGHTPLSFIEPEPNVFISGIKDFVANNVVEYLYEHCSVDSELMIFQYSNKTPGYKIRKLGIFGKNLVQINGLQLVEESKNK